MQVEEAICCYESHAQPGELQALIKCRAIAGTAAPARRFRRAVRDMLWTDSGRCGPMTVPSDGARSAEAAAEDHDLNNICQGPGGICDAEWTIQQLQLVVGPKHPRARAADSLRALEALRSLGAITLPETDALRSGYLFLRALDLRLQLIEELPMRRLPTDQAGLAALARRLGSHWHGEAAARALSEEHLRHRDAIRRHRDRVAAMVQGVHNSL